MLKLCVVSSGANCFKYGHGLNVRISNINLRICNNISVEYIYILNVLDSKSLRWCFSECLHVHDKVRGY